MIPQMITERRDLCLHFPHHDSKHVRSIVDARVCLHHLFEIRLKNAYALCEAAKIISKNRKINCDRYPDKYP